MTKKYSISNTKFCNYTIIGVAKGALATWAIVKISHTLRSTILPTLQKGHSLWLSEHGDVTIKTQTECLTTYLSFWLLS